MLTGLPFWLALLALLAFGVTIVLYTLQVIQEQIRYRRESREPIATGWSTRELTKRELRRQKKQACDKGAAAEQDSPDCKISEPC